MSYREPPVTRTLRPCREYGMLDGLNLRVFTKSILERERPSAHEEMRGCGVEPATESVDQVHHGFLPMVTVLVPHSGYEAYSTALAS